MREQILKDVSLKLYLGLGQEHHHQPDPPTLRRDRGEVDFGGADARKAAQVE